MEQTLEQFNAANIELRKLNTDKDRFISILGHDLKNPFCFTGCNPGANQNQEPVIKTSNGVISGSIDEGIFTFKGIPYAKADRFMPPQNSHAWDGISECVSYGPVAKQIVSWIDESNMDEKELFSVNVWTSGILDGKKRPVMLWLHGGGFHVGSSSDPALGVVLCVRKCVG